MSEAQAPVPPQPVPSAAASPVPPRPDDGQPARPRGGPAPALAVLAFALAALALAAAVALWHRSQDLAQRLEREHAATVARDQASAERERRLTELEMQWRQAQGEASAGVGVLAEADVRRRREQLALIDIERLVEQLQLQLRLGIAPQDAADALAVADARLGRMSGPAAARVREALRRDLARVKAAPDLDRSALAARLDPLLSGVDQWHASADPLHAAARPPAVPAAAAAAPAPVAAPGAGTDVGGMAARVRAWLEREFGDFMRIRQVDTPAALLLSPTQLQLLRDRVRLGVLDLRQAILARDERAIRAEAVALEMLLQRYFDPNQPDVAAAVVLVRATSGAALVAPRLSLDETLAALRAVRGGAGG